VPGAVHEVNFPAKRRNRQPSPIDYLKPAIEVAREFIAHFVSALPCPAIAHVQFEHLKKVINVVEQPAAQHIGEVIVQHLGVIAKLVRYLARCAHGIQRVGDAASTRGDIHGLLRRVRVDDGPFRNVRGLLRGFSSQFKNAPVRIADPFIMIAHVIGSLCIIHDLHNISLLCCADIV
jgi:hypothetical protein